MVSLQGLSPRVEEEEEGGGLECQSGVSTAGDREDSCGEISCVLSSHFILSGRASHCAYLGPEFSSRLTWRP